MQKKIGWAWALTGLLFFSCGEKGKKEPVQPITPTDTAKPSDHSKPDPKIAVKEDYSKITSEDIVVEDITHLDISYFPANYAILKANNQAVDLKIRVLYSRANKRGRSVIFGDRSLTNIPVAYGEVWRLGANESTEIEFLYDVQISGKKIKKGRYSLFAIAYPERWTVILNKDIFTWGAYNYNEKNDVARADIPVVQRTPPAEKLYIYFQKTNAGCNMIMTWDNVQVTLPITILQ